MNTEPTGGPGVHARRVAVQALVDIERRNSYANLALRHVLDRSTLEERDRHLVTELVYGVTRNRRSLDLSIDRFLSSDPPDLARAALRIGAYQLTHMGTADHAAVSATVSTVPQRLRGLVNAVLRKVATAPPPEWPDDATRLSYPNWIVERLIADLGAEDAIGALEAMNEASTVDVREDGYTQNQASQWVVEAINAKPGMVVADLCAAPGGKATGLASTGATVVAMDLRPKRVGLVQSNASKLNVSVRPVSGDATAPPLRSGSFDVVLVDAPCSGLGVLHRRPDARWRITADDVERLADLQVAMLTSAIDLVRPGGILVYSVCTLSAAETSGVIDRFQRRHPEAVALPPPELPWVPLGSGAIVLPQAAGTDGMALARWQIGSVL